VQGKETRQLGAPVVEVCEGEGYNEEDQVAAPAVVQMGEYDIQVRHEHDGVDTVVCHSTQPRPETFLHFATNSGHGLCLVFTERNCRLSSKRVIVLEIVVGMASEILVLEIVVGMASEAVVLHCHFPFQFHYQTAEFNAEPFRAGMH